jgi:TRAP-type C4-dicarboxylate transport system permease small subunit
MLCELFPAHRWMFDLLAKITTLVLALLIIASGAYFMWYSISNGIVSASLLEIPLWIPQLAIPLGGFGLFIETLIQLITGETPTEHQIVGD